MLPNPYNLQSVARQTVYRVMNSVERDASWAGSLKGPPSTVSTGLRNNHWSVRGGLRTVSIPGDPNNTVRASQGPYINATTGAPLSKATSVL